jgi:hypothetical protein
MKKYFVLALFLFSLFSANAQTSEEVKKGQTFGQKTDAADAIIVAELPAKVTSEVPVDIKIKGMVVDVCTMEGCWLKLQTAGGKMMVKMKDHAFTVPLSLNGKEVVVEGTAKVNVTSVAELRHYAEDAGKSAQEIEAIKEPKKEIVITANGILVI